jgi:hypothetical protein
LNIGSPKVRGANISKKSGLKIGSPKVRGANISKNLDGKLASLKLGEPIFQ